MEEEKKYDVESLEDLMQLKESDVEYVVSEKEDVEVEQGEEDTDDRPSDANSKASYNPKDIDIAVEPNTLYNILERLKYGEIEMNTLFQRKGGLWKSYYQSRLIESIMLRLPLPSFYFDASNDEKWLIVDGLQRLTALDRFVNKGAFKLHGLEVLDEYNGMKYEDLPRVMKRRINEFAITTYLIKPGTPKEVKYDVFNRINTGGLTLTAQEIRHALNQGKAADYVASFVYGEKNSETYDWWYKDYIGVNDDRMAGRELILRSIAFYNHHWSEYKPSLLNFLNDEMENLASYSDKKLEEIERLFWSVCRLLKSIFGEDVFSKSLATAEGEKKIRRLNSSLFEVWTSLLMRNRKGRIGVRKNKDKIVAEFKEILKDSEFDKAISYSTSSKKHVEIRFSRVENLINKYANVEEHTDTELQSL